MPKDGTSYVKLHCFHAGTWDDSLSFTEDPACSTGENRRVVYRVAAMIAHDSTVNMRESPAAVKYFIYLHGTHSFQGLHCHQGLMPLSENLLQAAISA